MNTISLKRKNQHGLNKLERVKVNTRTLTHEIRSPLSSIIMIMNLLIDLNGRPEHQQKSLKLQKQVKYLAKLLMNFVQDILDMKQIV